MHPGRYAVKDKASIGHCVGGERSVVEGEAR